MLLDVDNVFSSEEVVNLKEVAEAAVAEEE
jgi:hypothetical protein